MSAFPYLPLDAKGWRLHMGLRPLDASHWLEVDAQYGEEIALKNELLATHRAAVVATRSEGDEASKELLRLIVEDLRVHHPALPIALNASEHPIIQASRLVQEDLCVLVRDSAWRLVAACVCFPSRWDLATKIGTTLDDIHAPVPGYADALAQPTISFFDRLKPKRSFWRLNWTLLDDAALFQPRRISLGRSNNLDDWFLRVERQTLRRLEMTGAIVFTIRTYVTSVSRLRDDHDDVAVNLLRALDTASSELQQYKGWVGVADQLRDALP